jgi:hypothetical protein
MVKHPIVKISELRRIVNELLEHVEKVHGPDFRLEDDYYWDLNSDVIYDIKNEIEKVDEVGSLKDSWEFLFNMRDENIKEQGPSLMLTHAAPLLRYIGKKVAG